MGRDAGSTLPGMGYDYQIGKDPTLATPVSSCRDEIIGFATFVIYAT